MDENQKKNYLALWNGKRSAERNLSRYQRRDDGNHIYKKDEYYEWWYLDFSFDNGYHVVFTFQYMNAFMRPVVPRSHLMIYKPDGTCIDRYAGFQPDEIYAGADYCDLRMGNDWLKDTGDSFEVYMKIKGVGGHLTLKNIVPGWKPGTGLLYCDEDKGKVAGWCIPVPRGEVTGELFLDGEVLKVKGVGYHDHNWGNCSLHNPFETWYWGRVLHEKYTMIYFWIKPREKGAPIIAPLLFAKEGEIVLSTDMMNMDLSDFVRDEESGKDYAKKLVVTTDVMDVKLELSVQTKRKVQQWLLPKITEWDQYYCRFVADFGLKIDIDGVKDRIQGEMLHELMLL